MKKAAILILLLFAIFTAAAQKKQIDTLRLALSKAKTDTMRFEALRILSRAYYISNLDSLIIFEQQGYSLAKKNNWIANQAKCLNGVGNAYSNLGDYVKATLFHLKALRISEGLNDIFGMSTINNNIGSTYIQQDDYKKALTYLRLAQIQLNTLAS